MWMGVYLYFVVFYRVCSLLTISWIICFKDYGLGIFFFFWSVVWGGILNLIVQSRCPSSIFTLQNVRSDK